MKLQVPPGQTPSLILSICPTIADVSNCKVSVQQLDVNEQTGPSMGCLYLIISEPPISKKFQLTTYLQILLPLALGILLRMT